MKENLNDLRAFLLVAQTGSFTKAGAILGVSQSAVSHAMRGLEERLKIKLFHRTTRSISTTDAGEQLYQRISPLFDELDREINELSEFRDVIKGKLRINGTEHAFQQVLWEKLERFLRSYPEVELELVSENRFVDIVAERFDAGIRLGDDVAKDMIAVRVSEDLQMAVVASPAYLSAQGAPDTPYGLVDHQCLQMRLPTNGGVLNWVFKNPENPANPIKVQPHGQITASKNEVLKNAALSGFGLLWTPIDLVQKELARGELVQVLADWAMHYTGYYLYYPNRRENSALFKALVAALRE